MLLQLKELWNSLWNKLSNEGLYAASIGGIKLRLQELKAKDEQTRKTKAKNSEGWGNIDEVLHQQGLPYVPEIIRAELISRYNNNPLAGHFGIKKTYKLVARKYYWPTLHYDIKN